ncbi:DUF1648 domain-containing protein [Bacillus sp. WMMC1349]|uniref:DUF1648 domain-containing protein n=1 Tax=Bacillus sp. WMMC1349 TaxID=2736254 RepID=UPI001556577E|nr:DUF1648 domain-containing protein [Bacillus sp. WMMC1349]NPC92669.1 DUF1648 domain-containing protein [Bacillus sp. WMMC1349]
MNKSFLPIGIILVSLIVMIIAFPNVPHELPVHWSNGKPDQYVDKTWAMLLMPFLMVVSHMLCHKNNMTILYKVNMTMLSFFCHTLGHHCFWLRFRV